MKKGSDNNSSFEGGNGRYLFISSTPQALTEPEFARLKQPEQETIVAARGVLIALRQEPEFVIRLYQLENFYVEFYYHQISQRPVCIRSFSHTSGLDAYVNGMDLCFNPLV